MLYKVLKTFLRVVQGGGIHCDLLGFMDVKYFKSLLNISTFQTGCEKVIFQTLSVSPSGFCPD